MQDLHLVGFTTDRRHLIFSARRGAKSGSFVVPVDEHLLAAVEELADDPARLEVPEEETVEEPPPPPRVEAKLSVREVQARLRSGESTHDVAADAGVEEGWVERFAPPIRAEQGQIVERALGLPMERPRTGESAKPLGVAVAAAMAERDVSLTRDAFAAAWSSRLVGQDHWILEFRFTQRGRKRTVSWTFDADEGRITTTDRTASQIGFVAPPEPQPAKSSARKKQPAKRSASKKSAGKKTARKQAAGKKSAAKKPAAKKTAAKQSTGKKSPANKGPSASNASAGDEVTGAERSTRGDGRPDSAKSTAAVKKAVESTREALESGPVRRPAPPRPTRKTVESPDSEAPDDGGAPAILDPGAADQTPSSTPEQHAGEEEAVDPANVDPANVDPADVDLAQDASDVGVDAHDAPDARNDTDDAVDEPGPDRAAFRAVESDEAASDEASPESESESVDAPALEVVTRSEPEAEPIADSAAGDDEPADDDVEDLVADDGDFADENPADDEPGDEDPVDEDPADEDPAEDEPGDEDPVDEDAGVEDAGVEDADPVDAELPDLAPADEPDEADEDHRVEDPVGDERVRVRRATGRRGFRRRAATVPDEPSPAEPVPHASAPDSVNETEPVREDVEPRVPERRPTAQFRSGAAVPARQEPPPRRAVAPARETRTADQDAEDDADDEPTPDNGRRPRRTRPLRAR